MIRSTSRRQTIDINDPVLDWLFRVGPKPGHDRFGKYNRSEIEKIWHELGQKWLELPKNHDLKKNWCAAKRLFGEPGNSDE